MANGYRASATRTVDDLIDAARIFHAGTIDLAAEMIADTQRHDAQTVGELLAFMRKYRLMFAGAERVLDGGELYGRLYAALREQKEKLGVPGPTRSAGNGPPSQGTADGETRAELTPRSSDVGPGKCPVVGRWHHTPNRAEIEFKEDGTIIHRGRVAGSWTLTGSRMTLTWPDHHARGGAWIDEVEIAPDGTSYLGRNQDGGAIKGKRL